MLYANSLCVNYFYFHEDRYGRWLDSKCNRLGCNTPFNVFIGRTWLQSTVQNAVKHEYDVMLETIKTANTVILDKQKGNMR